MKITCVDVTIPPIKAPIMVSGDFCVNKSPHLSVGPFTL
jgi:hypothetical protein